jgi:hypothetical protein
MTSSNQTAGPSTLASKRHARLGDPALWAWLVVVLLALLPARAALHVILA